MIWNLLLRHATAIFFFVLMLFLLLILFSVFINSHSVYAKPSNQLQAVTLLKDPSIHYNINLAKQSSGLFRLSRDIGIEGFLPYIDRHPEDMTRDLRPDFKRHRNYWLSLPFFNQTDQTQWILHSSHFLIDMIEVLLIDRVTGRQYVFRQQDQRQAGNTLVNVLGKAIPLHLQKGSHYILVVKLHSDSSMRPPYIALMSEPYYKEWSGNMEFLYTLAVGIVIGLIVVALFAAMILKDSTFFWFSISSTLLLGFNILRSHLGTELVDSIDDNTVWLWLFIGVTQITLLLFVRAFLNEGHKTELIDRIFSLSLIISVFITPLSLVLTSASNSLVFSVNSLLFIAFVTYLGIHKIINDGKYYLIFMIGWLPLLFSLLESVSVLFVIPDNDGSTLSYKNLREPYLQLLHMTIHIIAMLIRIMTLKRKKIEAEVRTRAKSEFMAATSHDLKQPLHTMGFYFDQIERCNDLREIKTIFSRVKEVHQSITESFDALMDLEQLEAGHVAIQKDLICLNELCTSIYREYENVAHSKQIGLKVVASNRLIYTDPLILKRTLRNLTSNALKYTSQGRVLLCTRFRSNAIVIQVWDTGCGIDKGDFDAIFDLYKRSSDVERTYAGSGVGLATAKHLSDLMNYTIDFRSVKNKGSMFSVSLPMSEVDPSLNIHAKKISQQKDFVCYLAMDNTELRKEIGHCLTNWGYALADDNLRKYDDVLFIVDEKGASCIDNVNKQSFATATIIVDSTSGADIYSQEPSATDKGKLCRMGLPFRPAQLRSLIGYIEFSSRKYTDKVQSSADR